MKNKKKEWREPNNKKEREERTKEKKRKTYLGSTRGREKRLWISLDVREGGERIVINTRVCVLCSCVFCAYTWHERERKIIYREALSKYQFETAAARRYMRHAFHRPLRPAFHFYLYLPGRPTSFPSSRIVDRIVSRCPLRLTAGVRSRKGVALLDIFYDILFPIRDGEDVGGQSSRGIVGPYSTFMALNRDEVSSRDRRATPLLLPASSSSFFFFTSFDRKRCQSWLATCRRICLNSLW